MNDLFLSNTHSGLYLEVGRNNSITLNEFSNNTNEAIYLTGCGTSYIERNLIQDNGIGIHTFEATNNNILNNIIKSNAYGIHFEGLITVHSNFNTISHNQINDNTFSGIRIEHSQFNKIEFNEIIGNGRGIQFDFTAANLITNNNITSSEQVEIDLSLSFMDVFTKNKHFDGWCLDCHNPNDRDKLRLASGKVIPFTESYYLCGQCHGDIFRDWKAGVHGKRTGTWNGKKEYRLCVHCHWPHQPQFKPLEPLPPRVNPEDNKYKKITQDQLPLNPVDNISDKLT